MQSTKSHNSDGSMAGRRLTWTQLEEEEFQENTALSLVNEVYGGEQNAVKAAGLIREFIQSYSLNRQSLALDRWLEAKFSEYPELWRDDREIASAVQEVIASVDDFNHNRADLSAHRNRGLTTTNWLAGKLDAASTFGGAGRVASYASQIDAEIQLANRRNLEVITRQDGQISQAHNLDGFIAEQHHANSFNMDAAAKGSGYRARVLEPEPGQTYGKNSVDIGIYDQDGKLVRRYQSKYGSDPEATTKLFEKGDYRGQRKLVPEGHGGEGKTECIDIGGVQSKPLSKEEAKELQEQAQQRSQSKQHDWGELSNRELAKQLGKQAVISAGITAGVHGARILGRRIWNRLNGKQNQSANEDLREFFEASLKGARNSGIQVAVSGGLLIAAKKGLLGKALKNTPAGRIANIATVAMENAKVLYKLAKGEIAREEALDEMARTTTCTVAGIAAGTQGATWGAQVGAVFGPPGVAAGGVIGGLIGGMAGSGVAEAIYAAGKGIVQTAVKATGSVIESLYEAGSSFVDAVGSGVSRIKDALFAW